MKIRYGRGNVCSGKCLSGEMSSRESVLQESVRSRNCPFGEMSSGKCQSGKCPVGKLSYNRRRQCIVFLNSLVLHFRENLLEWVQWFMRETLCSGDNFSRASICVKDYEWFIRFFLRFLMTSWFLVHRVKSSIFGSLIWKFINSLVKGYVSSLVHF